MTPRQRRGRLALAASLAVATMLPACSGGARAPASASVAASPETTIEPWTFQTSRGSLARTPHYRLFTTAHDQLLVAILPTVLERNLARYRTELASLPAPDLKLDTFLMQSRPEWAALTREVMGPAASPFLAIERGGFASGGRALFWSLGLRDTLALAAHEGWHQYTQRVFRDELPLWLEEGVAVYMEGFVLDPTAPGGAVITPSPWANLERFDALRRAADTSTLRPLAALLDDTPADLLNTHEETALATYAQLWAFVLMLRESGDPTLRQGLSDALLDAADGRLVRVVETRVGAQAAQALRERRGGSSVAAAYLSADLVALDARHRAFIANILQTGSRERIATGLSPLSGAR